MVELREGQGYGAVGWGVGGSPQKFPRSSIPSPLPPWISGRRGLWPHLIYLLLLQEVLPKNGALGSHHHLDTMLLTVGS